MQPDLPASLIIRRIAEADASLLRAVRLRALQGEPLAFGSTYANEAPRDLSNWETWARDYASGLDKATFLTLRDGAPVGLVSGMRSDVAPHFGLFAMWVDVPERRNGLGRELVESVSAWIVASGGTRLTLWSPSPARERSTRASALLTTGDGSRSRIRPTSSRSG